MNKNRIRGWGTGVSLRNKTKPKAINRYSGKCGEGGAEAAILTRGGLQDRPEGTMDSVRDSEGSAEVSRGRSRTAGQSEGPNMSSEVRT